MRVFLSYRRPAGVRFGLFLAVVVIVAAVALVQPRPASAATHTVQQGETLSGIAAYYDVDLATLAAHNGLVNPDYVFWGQELAIPGDASPGPGNVTHLVEPGETLSMIAILHGVTLEALVGANGIDDPDIIPVGFELLVPAPVPNNVLVSAEAPRISQAQAEIILRQTEIEYGLPDGLLLALAWHESGWQQHVISYAGAVGLTQVLPSTAEWALEWLAPNEVDWATDPVDNARMGAAILRHWLDLTGGDTWAALAIYYQGWGSVFSQGPFEETYRYVANVLAVVPRFASGNA